MFESTLVSSGALLVLLVIGLQIAVKAAFRAWQDSGSPWGESDQEWGWWIQIQTSQPAYIYYFGPFSSRTEAEEAQLGFVQDLEQESAQGISVRVYWCKPRQLTAPIAAAS
ncbi:MAG TPA: DUF1816 domain-containing protein [Stenomitos sp.]